VITKKSNPDLRFLICYEQMEHGFHFMSKKDIYLQALISWQLLLKGFIRLVVCEIK